MKARFILSNVDQMDATLSVTLTIGEWKHLLHQLEDQPIRSGYPSTMLIEDITSMIRHVTEYLATAETDGHQVRP